jgi:hypothetical protein
MAGDAGGGIHAFIAHIAALVKCVLHLSLDLFCGCLLVVACALPWRVVEVCASLKRADAEAVTQAARCGAKFPRRVAIRKACAKALLGTLVEARRARDGGRPLSVSRAIEQGDRSATMHTRAAIRIAPRRVNRNADAARSANPMLAAVTAAPSPRPSRCRSCSRARHARMRTRGCCSTRRCARSSTALRNRQGPAASPPTNCRRHP